MSMYDYHTDGTPPCEGEVFVFGSNLPGIHGKGAALAALGYGAVIGRGRGRVGNTYAIPTKRSIYEPMTMADIRREVDAFCEYARTHSDTRFFVTRVGCGLAGYRDCDIAPMFAIAPPNCSFAEPWRRYLEDVRV